MAEKKPSYDELLKSVRDWRGRCLILNSLICLAGWFAYLFLLSALLDLAMYGVDAGLASGDYLPPFLYYLGYLFLTAYGVWHVVTRMADIWYDDLESLFDGISLFIDKLFRGIARGLAEDDGKKPVKKEQTELPVDKP